MNWTSVLFLLGYCQNATQNGFRLYVQFGAGHFSGLTGRFSGKFVDILAEDL